MVKRNKFDTPLKQLALAALVGLIIALGIFAYSTRGPSKGSGVIPSTNTANKTPAANPVSPSKSNSSTSDHAPTGAKNISSSDGNLLTPYGTFVSNHRPSLSGSAEQKSEQSTCNTTAGATCYIKFVKGDVVKTLQTQTTDARGATYWSWNISDSGFTEGTWQVSAVATLNGQSKTVVDTISLVVQP